MQERKDEMNRLFSKRKMLECDISTHIPTKTLSHNGFKLKPKNWM